MTQNHTYDAKVPFLWVIVGCILLIALSIQVYIALDDTASMTILLSK